MAVKRLAQKVSKNLFDDIYTCSFKRQTGVSLKNMMDFGAFPSEKNLLIAAQFLQKELSVRLAHRVVELENLPYGLNSKAPVLEVRDWYIDSFKEIHYFPELCNSNDELLFTEVISKVKERHKYVLPKLGLGIQKFKEDFGRTVELPEIHQVLDRFFLSRIGIRMLIGQHEAVHQKDAVPGYIGLISTRMSPVEVVRGAVEQARSLCLQTYGSAPEVQIFGDPNITFAYVRPHLHLMVYELVKNSLRAVHERFSKRPGSKMPAIRVVVADGIEDVTIKVSDEGGGISRSGLPKIWTYFYSTAKLPPETDNIEAQNVMAGFGYGLPITRLYARYFGGDIKIISMDGYGTDVYLYLNRPGNVREQLA